MCQGTLRGLKMIASGALREPGLVFGWRTTFSQLGGGGGQARGAALLYSLSCGEEGRIWFCSDELGWVCVGPDCWTSGVFCTLDGGVFIGPVQRADGWWGTIVACSFDDTWNEKRKGQSGVEIEPALKAVCVVWETFHVEKEVGRLLGRGKGLFETM